jgi:hypothetical protein
VFVKAVGTATGSALTSASLSYTARANYTFTMIVVW